MPKPYYPLALWNYTPVLRPMPVPDIQSATEAPLVCVQFSQALVPYVLGCLEIYRWRDKFHGTPEQVNTALGIIQDLIVILTEGNCPDCLEENMPTGFRFTEECGLEYTNDNGETYIPVPGWSVFAEICFKGEQGETGPVGPVGPIGETGPPGDDCDCVDPVPVQPVVPVGEDRCQTACNIAFGLGAWFYQNFEDKLDWLESAYEAASILVDIAGDFIEAFPTLGALVDTVINFLQNVAEVDIPALRSENNESFKEFVQCTLYEIMANDDDEFTAAYMDAVRDELAGILVLLPPQGPLLTLIGQSYAAMLLLFSPNDLLRRANLYKDNEGECDLCDVECGGECPEPITLTINCQNNEELIPNTWENCGSSPLVTSYETEQIAVTFPEIRLIKKITVNWRSGFAPTAPIDDGIITIGGTPYTQNITGTGNSTSPQTVDDLMVEASSFTIETTGTVNGTHPAGYCAFFSIVVEYCEVEP